MPYPIEVHHRIRRDEPADYAARPRRSLDACVDVVSIQHEYGIWGGEDGESRPRLRPGPATCPSVATLHTVLRDPTPGQRAVLSELVAPHRGHRRDVAVRRHPADERLRRRSRAPARHPARRARPAPRRLGDGQAPPRRRGSRRDPELRPARARQGLRARRSRRCPRSSRRTRTALYVIVGATHPDLLRPEGEAYRETLRPPGRAARHEATTSGSSTGSSVGSS